MSKIKLFALGGLNENGKNMFVIEHDDDIFVFEAGLKYADESTLGIDYVIPNTEYLKTNKNRIKGIFLTHGHDENIGAIPDIIEDLGYINVYGSKFTINVLKQEFESNKLNTNCLNIINVNKTISFGNVRVTPISLSHSIPDNFGYSVETDNGVIFYSSDYVFDPLMKGAYKTDIGRLSSIGKKGVLCLLTESIYADKAGFTSPSHRTASLIRETLHHSESRIIFNVLNSHLYKIQELFNEVSKTDRKIVVMGKRLQNTINEAINNKYLFINKSFIGDLNNINDDNVVILNSNEREKPYNTILKIVNGYDKFIKLKKEDTVFLATPVYEGMEKIYYTLLDDIAKIGCEIVTLSSKKYLTHHASSEDLMMMIDLLKPKYYFPIRGEYRMQFANGQLAEKMGISTDNILLKENGDVVTIENGNLIESFDKVPVGNISIDGDSTEDVGEVVLKDREMLSNNGIIIVTATINKKTKKLLAGPEILTRGFVYVKDNTELIQEIKDICNKIILENSQSNYVDYAKIKNSIRENLSKFLYNQAGNKPMIITVIQEI